MRKIYRASLISLGAVAFASTHTLAQTNTNPILVPSTSSSYNQQGFNLPSAPRATGQDIVRGSGGISCQSAVSGNGPILDMGVIGTNDIYSRDSTALYGRITVPLGKKPKRVDCSKLYDLEIQRLKMELQLMRAGGFGTFDDTDGVRQVLHQAEQAEIAPPSQVRSEKDKDTVKIAEAEAIPPTAPIVIPEEPQTNVELSEPEPMKIASLNPDIVGTVPIAPRPQASHVPQTRPDTAPAPVIDTSPQPADMSAQPHTQPIEPGTLPSPIPQAKTSQLAELTPQPHVTPRLDAPTSRIEPAPNEWTGVELEIIGNPLERIKKDHQLYMVQLGAFSSHEGSEKAWNIYRSKIPSSILDYSAVSTPVERNGKTLYHLRVGPFERHMTKKICRDIKTGCFAIKG